MSMGCIAIVEQVFFFFSCFTNFLCKDQTPAAAVEATAIKVAAAHPNLFYENKVVNT